MWKRKLIFHKVVTLSICFCEIPLLPHVRFKMRLNKVDFTPQITVSVLLDYLSDKTKF